ncbi:unnamed protein product [Phaeothamnion confervicola]
MTATRLQVVAGFRRLMRARVELFAGDDFAMEASRVQLKAEFRKYRDVTDPKKLATLIKGITEVEEMMAYNVVQSRLNERGNYAVSMTPQQAKAMRRDEELEPITATTATAGVKIDSSDGGGCGCASTSKQKQ